MLRSLLISTQFLTTLPVPSLPEAADPRALPRAAGAFPIVGAFVGAIVALACAMAAAILPAPIAVLVALIAWRRLVGPLHADGLADLADGLACLPDRDRALRAMKDSAVGANGAAALTLCLLYKLALLWVLIMDNRLELLIVACAAGRWALVALAAWLPYAPRARQGSLAWHYVNGIGNWQQLGGLLWLATIALAVSPASLCALPVAAVAVALLGLQLLNAFGGITGDGLGAASEVVELAVLTALIAMLQPDMAHILPAGAWQSPLAQLRP